MPQMYENPVQFLQTLSRQIQAGWAMVEFDYHKEHVILMKDDDFLKANVRRGRVEWIALSTREEEVIRGTSRFFIL